MFIRTPSPTPFANSSARWAILLRGARGHRMIEIGDRTVTILAILSALLLAWYLFATIYLVMRDDLVRSLANGRHDTIAAYETRIAELRGRIDKITAKQVINQDTIEDRVSGLIARQAELEARHVMVADLGGRAHALGLPDLSLPSSSLPNSPLPDFFSARAAGPEVSTGSVRAFAPHEQHQERKPSPLPPEAPSQAGAPGFEALKMRGTLSGAVLEVEQRTLGLERRQLMALQQIEHMAQAWTRDGTALIQAVGLTPTRFIKTGAMAIVKPSKPGEWNLRTVEPGLVAGTAQGGPLLPAIGAGFGIQIEAAERALLDASQAASALDALPLGQPIAGAHEITSGFGNRVDPFTRSLALHSGLDFRATTGSQVRAAAGGKVIEAGTSGGYGRMVEIDHGFGLTTRYAHLSAILVQEGAVIKKGALLGLVGSTGRSTGPHLHYEVRVDDDATDPMRFVRAARLMAPELQ